MPLPLVYHCFGHFGLASVEDPNPSGQGFGKLPKEKIPGAREPQAHREMAAVKLKECVGAPGAFMSHRPGVNPQLARLPAV